MNKTCCVYDSGVFMHVAESMTRYFDRVLYYNPYLRQYTRSENRRVGDGLAGVEHILTFWDHVNDIDLFIFPDSHGGDIQEHLRSIGKRVWGCGRADELEHDRVLAKGVFKKVGLASAAVAHDQWNRRAY